MCRQRRVCASHQENVKRLRRLRERISKQAINVVYRKLRYYSYCIQVASFTDMKDISKIAALKAGKFGIPDFQMN
jgi:hypothetical protein